MAASSSTARSSLIQGAHESDSPYQRHGANGSAPTANSSPGGPNDVFRDDDDDSSQQGFSWKCTDFGHVGGRSRDGSVHVTDEVFSSASHLCACMLSILGTVLLITQSSAQRDPWKIVTFSLYGASLIFLFGASTLHHSIIGSERVETFLRMVDYFAIYPLIAGTFTPLCLVFYHDSSIGWSFAAVVWGIAALGMMVSILQCLLLLYSGLHLSFFAAEIYI